MCWRWQLWLTLQSTSATPHSIITVSWFCHLSKIGELGPDLHKTFSAKQVVSKFVSHSSCLDHYCSDSKTPWASLSSPPQVLVMYSTHIFLRLTLHLLKDLTRSHIHARLWGPRWEASRLAHTDPLTYKSATAHSLILKERVLVFLKEVSLPIILPYSWQDSLAASNRCKRCLT